MKRFMLLIREDLGRLEQLSQDQMEMEIAEMNDWVKELTKFDNFEAGEPLENEVKLVGKFVATDGPFVEAKDGISGYMIIRAMDIDQASEIANQCPHVLNGTISIEVRPIMEIGLDS